MAELSFASCSGEVVLIHLEQPDRLLDADPNPMGGVTDGAEAQVAYLYAV